MFIEIEEYTKYLVKYKITPNQFLFLYLRKTLNTDALEFYINGVKAWKREELQDLVNRGFLDDVNSPGEEYAHAYFVTPKFLGEMFIEFEEAGNELWTEYPQFFFLSDGKRVAARTCDKEELEKTYGKRIKHSRKKHEKIMELVKKLKKENRIDMGIEKFVTSEHWSCYFKPDETSALKDRRVSGTSHEV
jgi:hypothetical protein